MRFEATGQANKNLRLADFARRWTDDPNPLAQIVDERFSPTTLVLASAAVVTPEAHRKKAMSRKPAIMNNPAIGAVTAYVPNAR